MKTDDKDGRAMIDETIERLWAVLREQADKRERRFFTSGEEVHRGTPQWEVAPIRYLNGNVVRSTPGARRGILGD